MYVVYCKYLYYTTVQYSILQYTTVYYSTLQYTTVHYLLQVIDCVMALRNRCYAEEEDKHKRDFDWLLEAVNKVTIASPSYSLYNLYLPPPSRIA